MGEEIQIKCKICEKKTKALKEEGVAACMECGCVDPSVSNVESMHRELKAERSTEGENATGDREFDVSKADLDRTWIKRPETYGSGTVIPAIKKDAFLKPIKIPTLQLFVRLRQWDQRITRSKADEKWKNKNRMLQKIAGALFSELDGALKDEFSKIYRKTLYFTECSECDCSGEFKTTNDDKCVKCDHSKKNHKYSLEKGRHAVRMMLGAYCVALKRFKITPPFTEIEKILAGKDLPGVDIPSRRISQRTRKHHGTITTIFQYYGLIITKLGMTQELPSKTAEDEVGTIIMKMYGTSGLKFPANKIIQSAIDFIKKAIISKSGAKPKNVAAAAIFLAFKKEGLQVPDDVIMDVSETNITSLKRISKKINSELKLGLI